MTTYRHDVEDARGDLVDIELYCSAICWEIAAADNPEMGEAYGNAYPCPEQADYAQHCAQCGTLLVWAIDWDARTAELYDRWQGLRADGQTLMSWDAYLDCTYREV